MSDPGGPGKRDRSLGDRVGKKEQRKLRAERDKERSIWFGFGTFGVIGWSVAIPTLIGLAVGIWIDRSFPSRYSWTLMFLLIGLIAGCLAAWYWVKFESGLMNNNEEEDEEYPHE